MSEEKKYSVALCGFYGKSNYGDDLMADCLSQRLQKANCEVNLYSDVARDGIINGLRDDSYLSHDVVVIGGGNIIGPNFWTFKENRIEKLQEVEQLIFLNVGVTQDYLSNESFAKQLRNLNATWWVRDAESVDLLKNINIEAKFLPDISLTLEIIQHREEKKLGVLLNAYPMNDLFSNDNVYLNQRAHQFARLLAHHLDWMSNFGWKISFLPCHVSQEVDDRLIAAVVYGYMHRKNNVEWHIENQTWQELAKSIANCSLVMSMRYHTSTTAIVTKTPFVDLIHHAKNQRFVQSMNVEKCAVNMWTATHDDIIAATIAAENNDVSNWTHNDKAKELWQGFDKEWVSFLNTKEKQKC